MTPVIAKSKVAASAGVVGIIATALNRRDDDAALDSASIESLMLSGDLGAALASVDRMLSDPDNQKAHLLCIRGSILRRWGRLSEAASTYAHARERGEWQRPGERRTRQRADGDRRCGGRAGLRPIRAGD